MKLYKLVNILILIFSEKNFVLAILIDDFIDQDKMQHFLTQGTELKNFRRHILGPNWEFPNTGSQIALDRSDDKHVLRYVFRNDTISFNNISTFNFNIVNYLSINKEQRPLMKIILRTDESMRTIDNIDFLSTYENINSKTCCFVDLNNLPYLDSGKNVFDSNSINAFAIYFNTNNALFQMGLDSIEAVPEPFSTIILAGGTLNFIRKRRRQKVYYNQN